MEQYTAAKRFKWIKIADDGVVEFYCDNSMLSAIRECEQFFIDTYIKNYRHTTRNWNFDFGSWLHKCLELFYWHEYNKYRKILNPDYTTSKNELSDYEYCSKGKLIAYGLLMWDKLEMDYFKDRHKNYKMLDGAIGAVAMLSDYWDVYGGGKERFRVIGIETPFGLGKEVPIADKVIHYPLSIQLENHKLNSKELKIQLQEKFRAYLTGRLDLMVADSANVMSIMDHKSTAFFDGSESTRYTPHDGLLGYVYTGDCLVKKITEFGRVSSSCRRAIVNFCCLSQKDKNDKVNNKVVRQPELRFTRVPLTFSPEQLNEYRLRQISTFATLYDLVILERPAQWNTSACGNMYHKDCPFKDVHSITPSQRDVIMQSQFKIVEEWNPFSHESDTNL